MRIRFIGLIAHVRNNNNDRLAVLVHDTGHVPKLIYHAHDEVGQQDTKSPAVVCKKLENTRVTTSLTGKNFDMVGLAGVPKLANVGGAGKNLHAELHKNNPVANRFTCVMTLNTDALRGASYYVEDWFDDHGTFNGMFGAGRDFCMPQTVVLDIQTSADVTFTITPTSGAPTTISFKPVATVTITNAEETTGSGDHFHLFGKIFEDASGGGVVAIQGPKPEGRTCTHGVRSVTVPKCPEGGGVTIGVECSNSQYP